MKAILVIHKTLGCPACGKDTGHPIDHILSGGIPFGPWYCPHCFVGTYGEINAEGELEVRADPGCTMRKTLITLEIPPQEHTIHLLVKGMAFHGEALDGEKHRHTQRFFYEEHTCTENILRAVERVTIDGDKDPHGVATFIKVEEWRDLDAFSEPEGCGNPECWKHHGLGKQRSILMK